MGHLASRLGHRASLLSAPQCSLVLLSAAPAPPASKTSRSCPEGAKDSPLYPTTGKKRSPLENQQLFSHLWQREDTGQTTVPKTGETDRQRDWRLPETSDPHRSQSQEENLNYNWRTTSSLQTALRVTNSRGTYLGFPQYSQIQQYSQISQSPF